MILQIGYANLPYYFRRYPRFASGIAHEEKGKFALGDSPDSLYFWSVLGPLFGVLYRPIALRTTDPPGGDRDEHRKEWKSVDDWYRGLGIEVEGELSVIRYGGGWSKLRSADRLAAKEALLLALDGPCGRRRGPPPGARDAQAHRAVLRPCEAWRPDHASGPDEGAAPPPLRILRR